MKYFKNIPDRPLTNWLIMLVMATAIMMLLSRDSYLYLLGPRCDSAWFFMCGKAWMNGMVPYVDFADSKGPLLWLIYGVGYLLSHYDYHGVFWVSVIVYSFTLYFLFKTAQIFVNNRSQAVLAVLMTSVIIFNPITHFDTQAEDYCLFYTSLSLWQLCRMLYAEHTKRDELMAFWVFGISLAGTLLIKYNITAMCCVFPAIGLYYLIREHHQILRPLLACASGFFILVLPFLIYFFIQGNFSAFIQEYFINTLQTIENRNGVFCLSQFFNAYKYAFVSAGNRVYVYFFFCLILFICCTITKKHVFFVIYVVYLLINIHSKGSYYYYNSGLPAMIICCIFFIIYLKRRKYNYIILFLVSAIIIIGSAVYNLRQPWSISNSYMNKQISEVELLMQIKRNVRVLNYAVERGFGITSNSLPATKYWSRQTGATMEMKESARRAIRDCDVVTTDNWYPDSLETRQYVLSNGFKLVYRFQMTPIPNDIVYIFMRE